MWARWHSTVLADIASAAATCWLDAPSATASATCCSRGVSDISGRSGPFLTRSHASGTRQARSMAETPCLEWRLVRVAARLSTLTPACGHANRREGLITARTQCRGSKPTEHRPTRVLLTAPPRSRSGAPGPRIRALNTWLRFSFDHRHSACPRASDLISGLSTSCPRRGGGRDVRARLGPSTRPARDTYASWPMFLTPQMRTVRS
jgi:hypothetical protein